MIVNIFRCPCTCLDDQEVAALVVRDTGAISAFPANPVPPSKRRFSVRSTMTTGECSPILSLSVRFCRFYLRARCRSAVRPDPAFNAYTVHAAGFGHESCMSPEWYRIRGSRSATPTAPYRNLPSATNCTFPPTRTSIALSTVVVLRWSREGRPISYPCSTLVSMSVPPKYATFER